MVTIYLSRHLQDLEDPLNSFFRDWDLLPAHKNSLKRGRVVIGVELHYLREIGFLWSPHEKPPLPPLNARYHKLNYMLRTGKKRFRMIIPCNHSREHILTIAVGKPSGSLAGLSFSCASILMMLRAFLERGLALGAWCALAVDL